MISLQALLEGRGQLGIALHLIPQFGVGLLRQGREDGLASLWIRGHGPTNIVRLAGGQNGQDLRRRIGIQRHVVIAVARVAPVKLG